MTYGILGLYKDILHHLSNSDEGKPIQISVCIMFKADFLQESSTRQTPSNAVKCYLHRFFFDWLL